MLTKELLESKGFIHDLFDKDRYTIINNNFSISLFLGNSYSYCYLFTDDSDEGCFFDKLNEDKLNIILDFINKFNNAN